MVFGPKERLSNGAANGRRPGTPLNPRRPRDCGEQSSHPKSKGRHLGALLSIPSSTLGASSWRKQPMKKRLRFKQDKALGERLIKEAQRAREKTSQLPPGAEREHLLKNAREAD